MNTLIVIVVVIVVGVALYFALKDDKGKKEKKSK